MRIFRTMFFWIFCFILVIVLFVSGVILLDSIVHPLKVPSFFGWKPFIVLTSSMENTIMSGDLVVVKEKANLEFNVNDIVAFKKNNVYITHRIVDIKNIDGGQRFITKGDNNKREDNDYIVKDDIEGIYVCHVSNLGNVLMFIQKPIGMFICLLFPFSFIFLQEYIGNKKEKKQLEEKIVQLEKKK